jgi:hypothetical protein
MRFFALLSQNYNGDVTFTPDPSLDILTNALRNPSSDVQAALTNDMEL